MEVHERECVKKWSASDDEGQFWESEVGRIYTCGVEKPDGSVMVFSNYWLRVPAGVMVDPRPCGTPRTPRAHKLTLWENIKLRFRIAP